MDQHRTDRLNIYGVEIDKLQNGRYRTTVRCESSNNTEGWYKDYIENFSVADFDSLASTPFDNGGVDAREGMYFPDQRLRSWQRRFIPNKDTPVIEFVYETLTTTFVQVKDDDTDYELNGLRRVTRTLIARAGTDYQKTVGTSTINHQIDTETALTLYLASYSIDDTDGAREVTETWIEAGTLNVTTREQSDGVIAKTTTFLVNEGTTVGPIISRQISNFEGLQTITVTELLDSNGNSIVQGGENLVNQFKTLVNFSYPGVVSLESSAPETYISKYELFINEPPAQAKIPATVYVSFQTSGSVATSDFSYQGASGLWSPNNWASVKVSARGTFGLTDSFITSKGLRGYRCASTSVSGFILPGLLQNARFFWQGAQVLSQSSNISLNITVDQGPPDPIGSKWVLDADVKAAFKAVDGTTYYKKTIVVTDTVPTQVSNALPYT